MLSNRPILKIVRVRFSFNSHLFIFSNKIALPELRRALTRLLIVQFIATVGFGTSLLQAVAGVSQGQVPSLTLNKRTILFNCIIQRGFVYFILFVCLIIQLFVLNMGFRTVNDKQVQ